MHRREVLARLGNFTEARQIDFVAENHHRLGQIEGGMFRGLGNTGNLLTLAQFRVTQPRLLPGQKPTQPGAVARVSPACPRRPGGEGRLRKLSPAYPVRGADQPMQAGRRVRPGGTARARSSKSPAPVAHHGRLQAGFEIDAVDDNQIAQPHGLHRARGRADVPAVAGSTRMTVTFVRFGRLPKVSTGSGWVSWGLRMVSS